jgi:DNA-binding NtrC family response regulator
LHRVRPEVTVALIADRFKVRMHAGPNPSIDTSDARAWCPARDLATGDAVMLFVARPRDSDAEQQWHARCLGFEAMHHPHVARLIDHGSLDVHTRFEAWRATRWSGPTALARSVRRSAAAYLAASGFSACLADDVGAELGEWEGQPVVLPSARAGYLVTPPSEAPIEHVEWGLAAIDRPAVSTIAELVCDAGRREPCAIALWGEAGSGLRVAVRAVARLARTHGMVPMDVSAADERVWREARDRSFVIIGRSSGGSSRLGWRWLLDAGARCARSHLLLIIGTHEVPGIANVRLEPVSTETLLAAVRPRTHAAARQAVLERAALQSRGLPGRFMATISRRRRSLRYAVGVAERPRAAEPAPHYGPAAAHPPRPRPWPISGAASVLRERLDAALLGLRAGHHVSAERAIRGTVGALARRGDFGAAARGWLALARACVRRGQIAAAREALDEARLSAQRADDEAALVDVGVVGGVAAVDAGALGDAETLLRGAVTAARARGHADLAGEARAALSRALFWQGRFEEAADQVSVGDDDRLADRELVVLCTAAARAAAGLRAPVAGLAAAARAAAAADRAHDPDLIARATCASAFVHLTVDDRVGVIRDVDRCVTAARAARDPLRALRARLMAAEVHRRDGRSDRATRLLARVQALSRAPLPAPVQARVRLLRHLLSGGEPAALGRIGAATGFAAVTLFAPAVAAGAVGEAGLADLLELLAGTQHAGDDRAALAAVCGSLRGRLRAAAVAFVVSEAAALVIVTAAGSRPDAGVASRVMAAGQPVRIQPPAGGALIGVPVQYGGRLLGVLAARWGAGIEVSPDRSVSLMVMAAAIAAPALAAAIARPGGAPATANEILGTSAAIEAVRQAVARAGHAPYPVLIEGESGCGKELVARAVHRHGSRRDRRFCAVNCAALPDELLEAELFGHARGAFTGAVSERPGIFEEAHGGTLFLDEVGELSPRAQAKLLRTVQEGEVRRLGENAARRVDVRLVAATNRDLRREAAAGRFRHDLLYRLDVIRIPVPPLRERPDDIGLLIDRFWREAAERVRSRAVLSADTLAALARYHWPGNVRELQNAMAALVVASPSRGVVRPSALPVAMRGGCTPPAPSLDEARRAFDAQFVRSALARAGGHRGRAAGELGLSRQGLTKLMARLGLAERDADAGPGAAL